MKCNRAGVVIAVVVSFWLSSVGLGAQTAELPPEVIRYADTILYNGKILTADSKFTVVEAVAVRDGRFMAIGKTADIQRMAGPQTRRIDLQGKTATPGIIDMHGGPGGGSLMRYWSDKWMSGERRWTTKAQAREGLRRVVARAKPGEPIALPLYELPVDVDTKAGGRAGVVCDIFTLKEIDEIAPDNPLFFLRTVNQVTMAMNSKGAEVTKRFLPKGVSTPYLEEGNMCVAEGPQVDGILKPGQWAGNDYVYWIDPPHTRLDAYRKDVQRYAESGVTLGKQHMGVPLFNGLHALWERGELNMRFRMPFPMTPHVSGHTTELPPDMDAESFFRRWGNMSHIGDNMLRFAGVRIPSVGGNVPGGDAWMLEPKINDYPDRWGNQSAFGGRLDEQKAMAEGLEQTFRARDVLIQATRFGWDVSCDHCVGDRSFREVLKAYEEGLKTQIVKRENQRITTNHTPFATEEDIKTAAKLGVWSSISTGHAFGGRDGADMEAGVHQFGADRLSRLAAPVKSFIEHGLRPSLEGTIWPDANAARKSAFFWIGKAITRTDEVHGRVWGPKQRLSRQEALWASTLWPAEQLAEAKDLGSIELGKEADLVILDGDYMTMPEEKIGDLKVLLTMLGGRVVHETPSALRTEPVGSTVK